MMLAMSDEVDTARRRDAEARLVQEDVRKGREDVAKEVVRVLSGKDSEKSNGMKVDGWEEEGREKKDAGEEGENSEDDAAMQGVRT